MTKVDNVPISFVVAVVVFVCFVSFVFWFLFVFVFLWLFFLLIIKLKDFSKSCCYIKGSALPNFGMLFGAF